jgi:hypothetical protein
MRNFNRTYAGNQPVQGIFKKKTWLEKMGRDNPTMLLLMGVGIGVAGGYLGAQMMGKKGKKRR